MTVNTDSMVDVMEGEHVESEEILPHPCLWRRRIRHVSMICKER